MEGAAEVSPFGRQHQGDLEVVICTWLNHRLLTGDARTMELFQVVVGVAKSPPTRHEPDRLGSTITDLKPALESKSAFVFPSRSRLGARSDLNLYAHIAHLTKN